MKRVMPVPKPCEPDMIHIYTCQKCGKHTVTVDIHEGVTPFMLRCRASGREGDCDGMAESSFYLRGPKPAWIPEPGWEWFTPTGSEYHKLSEEMKDHVDMGGLDLRRRAAPSALKAFSVEVIP